MFAHTYRTGMAAPAIRVAAAVALFGGGLLASPLAMAQNAAAPMPRSETAAIQAPRIPAAKGATEAKAETVEQRIASLHAALKITPAQETAWGDVAQAMRENAADMEKLIGERAEVDPKTMTAVQDLQSYQKFAQAHVDGLKNLISAFDTLYASLPDSQKKIADEVFQSSGREHGHARS